MQTFVFGEFYITFQNFTLGITLEIQEVILKSVYSYLMVII